MRIVVGIDLRLDGTGWLVERAVAFADRMGATVDLLWVGSADRRPELEALAEAHVPKAARGRCLTLEGDVVATLGEVSKGCDALVIGPRAPEGIQAFLESAMATRVVKVAHCPVYVPRTRTFGTRTPRLLVGVDVHGKNAARVVGWAGTWAALVDGTVSLLYTLPGSLPAVRRPEMAAAAERQWRQKVAPERAALAELMDEIPTSRRGDCIVLPGEAEDALLARSGDYDLVLVGSRERQNLLPRLLVGHVADHIIRGSRCDVLVLPTARAFSD